MKVERILPREYWIKNMDQAIIPKGQVLSIIKLKSMAIGAKGNNFDSDLKEALR